MAVDRMNHFRNIADEALKDLKADEVLKARTLAGCRDNRRKYGKAAGYLAAAAVCFLLILGMIRSIDFAMRNSKPEQEHIVENNPASDDMSQTLMANNDPVSSWEVDSPEAAEKAFGDSFLSPSFLPEGFKPGPIRASGGSRDVADKIVMEYAYAAKSQLYTIIQEKAEAEVMESGYREVEFNGKTGHIKSEGTTELIWFADGVKYTIAGSVTEDQALRIAESMD